MTKILEQPIEESRVCRDLCTPEPQPLDNFYKYRLASKEGFDLYKSRCKKCTIKREQKRYASLPPDKRGRKRETGGSMKLLATIDLIPCALCHIRGHVAGTPGKCTYGGGASLGLGQSGSWGAP